MQHTTRTNEDSLLWRKEETVVYDSHVNRIQVTQFPRAAVFDKNTSSFPVKLQKIFNRMFLINR